MKHLASVLLLGVCLADQSIQCEIPEGKDRELVAVECPFSGGACLGPISVEQCCLQQWDPILMRLNAVRTERAGREPTPR